MRVLCVTPMFPEPGRPAWGSFVEEICAAVGGEGITIDILKRGTGRRGAISYAELLARGLGRGGPYDLVWGHYLGAAGAVGLALARRHRIPLVMTAHGSDVEAAGGRFARLALRQLIDRCAGLHFVSQALEDRARDLNGPWRCPTLAQPIGVDLSRFELRSPPPRTARKRVLMVGSFVPHEGWAEAIIALSTLSDLDLDLVAIGDGDAGWVSEMASDLGVSDRLVIRPTRPHHEMPELYREADVVIVPSHREGFGLVPLEAMACGVPVVCSGVGGMAEYARDGDSARVVRPGDGRRLGQAVRELLGNPIVRERLVAGGRAVAPRYDIRRSARRLGAFFVSLGAR